MIRRALDAHLGLPFKPAWIDLAQVAPAALPGEARGRKALDDWLALYGIPVFNRHDAVADALATAQLFLALHAPALQAGTADRRALALASGRGPMDALTPDRALANAADVDAVAAAARAWRDAMAARVRAGADSATTTAAMTAFNDAATCRLITIVGAEAPFRDAGACWIALGSEGRNEQTLASDQDNALVFADGADSDAVRARLMPWASRVNDALDRCGLAHCRGDIMAGKWCLSESAWRERFAAWMRTPDPAALLNAVVFFDFRAIAGKLEAGRRACVRGWPITPRTRMRFWRRWRATPWRTARRSGSSDASRRRAADPRAAPSISRSTACSRMSRPPGSTPWPAA